MISLVFDTETSGLSAKDHTSAKNGKLLQLYAALYEHAEGESFIRKNAEGQMECTATPFATLSTYLDAQVDVPPDAFKVHGIDKAKQAKLGADPFNVACLFEDMLDIADTLVAHNLNFDYAIIKHFLWSHDREIAYLDTKAQFCTMRTLKPLMRLEPKKYGDWRFPKLIEGYQYMFDRDFEGDAHDASADAKAAADLYFGLLYMQSASKA